MPNSPPPSKKALRRSPKKISTTDGIAVELYNLNHKRLSDNEIAAWANHFRQQYVADDKIDILRSGTGHSRREYLLNLKFPDSSVAPGPSVRSGDFGEIVILDLLEHKLGYITPRWRIHNKFVRNESPRGADILGFKKATNSPEDDELICVEVKCYLTKTLLEAITAALADSAKDNLRLGEALNALKQRYAETGQYHQVSLIERFQNRVDRPFKLQFGAAGISQPDPIPANRQIPAARDRRVILVTGDDLQQLVANLYELAASNA